MFNITIFDVDGLVEVELLVALFADLGLIQLALDLQFAVLGLLLDALVLVYCSLPGSIVDVYTVGVDLGALIGAVGQHSLHCSF
jgi:hypothetical protein